ncbi:hypothetical protein ACO2Q0_11325 [Phenylobacterium sp. VNQ135]|uniref:hypothetical protein n=1 Tax=Phenylobacterium sp. VNQ135 TaxID=3400922 RepID=UPI003C074BD1
MSDIYIGGVPFLALGHHDGRFIRTAGLFAFARRQPGSRYLVLHLEIAEGISRSADASHPRWGWALRLGMDTLLVHLFSRKAILPADATPDWETVDWHPQAQVALFPEPPVEADRSLPARPDSGAALQGHSASRIRQRS